MKYYEKALEGMGRRLASYEFGLQVISDPVIEVRAGDDLYVSFGWLSEPVITYQDTSYTLWAALENLPEEFRMKLVKGCLDAWRDEFFHLFATTVNTYGENSNQLKTIFNSIREGQEYNVYVPGLEANFSNECPNCDEDADPDELEGLELVQYWFAELCSCYDDYYGVLEEEQDRAEDERTKNGIEKLKAIKAQQDIERLAKIKAEHDKALAERQAKDEAEARAAAQSICHRATDFASVCMRKLRMDLDIWRKKQPAALKLNVAGWVVRVKKSKKTGQYIVKFPWVEKWLGKKWLGAYYAAQNDEKCPVAWELIYLINRTLQELCNA